MCNAQLTFTCAMQCMNSLRHFLPDSDIMNVYFIVKDMITVELKILTLTGWLNQLTYSLAIKSIQFLSWITVWQARDWTTDYEGEN